MYTKKQNDPNYDPRDGSPYLVVTDSMLIYQIIQATHGYSEFDIKAMLSALSDDEKKMLDRYAEKARREGRSVSNDSLARCITIVQDLRENRISTDDLCRL